MAVVRGKAREGHVKAANIALLLYWSNRGQKSEGKLNPRQAMNLHEADLPLLPPNTLVQRLLLLEDVSNAG